MFRFPALLALCCVVLPVWADGAVPVGRLAALLEGMRSIRADFEQQLLDSNGELIQSSNGTLMLSHPARFRWLSSAPYEQLVVSDGVTVWQYDPDLMQVVVRPLDQRADQVPTLLLSGDVASVRQHYTIEPAEPQSTGEEGFRLLPIEPDGLFSELHISFLDGALSALVIADGFGQQTALRFEDVETVQAFAEGTFSFIAPPDVDVLYDD